MKTHPLSFSLHSLVSHGYVREKGEESRRVKARTKGVRRDETGREGSGGDGERRGGGRRNEEGTKGLITYF
eukprot:757160-Hanusia_phi.AAC.6